MLVLVLAFLCQAAISVAAIPVLHQLPLRDRTSEIRALADTAYSTVAHYYDESRRGAMTDTATRRAARDAVRAMRYDGTNYFFIWALDGTSIAHGAHPEWEGRRFRNSAQAKKQPGVSYMVAQLIAAADSLARERVSTYRIPKLGTTLPLDKLRIRGSPSRRHGGSIDAERRLDRLHELPRCRSLSRPLAPRHRLVRDARRRLGNEAPDGNELESPGQSLKRGQNASRGSHRRHTATGRPPRRRTRSSRKTNRLRQTRTIGLQLTPAHPKTT